MNQKFLRLLCCLASKFVDLRIIWRRGLKPLSLPYFRESNASERSFKPLLHICIPLACCGMVIAADRPNIIFILADDIGYGDFGCYGAKKVQTPNVDRLAAQGLRMTDAHSMASVCTPTRYSFLTGEYAFRKKGTGIASGVEGLLIDTHRTTVPSLLKRAGYTTGIVGKWHLGLGTTPTDYNGEIKPGPLEIGFDHAWIMPATGDRVPCVWVENHRVVNLDPSDPIKLDYRVNRGDPESFVKGIPRIGKQTGGTAALWDDENISTVIAEKSRAFIEQNKGKPFFLNITTHGIHVPRAPNPKFRGKSQCGVRGDAIVEFDWTIGQILTKLEELKIADNTLVILSSDNGGVLDNNGPDKVHGIGSHEANNGHQFNGVLRGTKSNLWEGGNRVPMIVRWPARIQPGVSDALVCQVDMLASFAALTGQTLAAADGPDSFNVLPALLGQKTDTPCRDHLVSQNNDGIALALRQGPWKFIPNKRKQPAASGELYNLSEDLAETRNIAEQHPDIVKTMAAKLSEIRKAGRSR
jgi:arylsulfatase A-like enzyme